MAVPVRTIRPTDRIVHQKRTRLWWQVIGGLTLVIVLVGCSWWLVVRSPWMRVTDIEVSGGSTALQEQVRTLTNQYMHNSWLGVRTLLPMVRVGDLQAIIARGSDVATVSVAKRYWHALDVQITTRIPVGLWCVNGECQYVDAAGTRWGTAPLSRGPLLLLVEDQRVQRGQEERIWSGIQALQRGLASLGMVVMRVRVIAESAMHVELVIDKPYALILDTSHSIEDQLAALESYLASRPSLAGVTYLDLRTPQRVYVGKSPTTE